MNCDQATVLELKDLTYEDREVELKDLTYEDREVGDLRPGKCVGVEGAHIRGQRGGVEGPHIRGQSGG